MTQNSHPLETSKIADNIEKQSTKEKDVYCKTDGFKELEYSELIDGKVITVRRGRKMVHSLQQLKPGDGISFKRRGYKHHAIVSKIVNESRFIVIHLTGNYIDSFLSFSSETKANICETAINFNKRSKVFKYYYDTRRGDGIDPLIVAKTLFLHGLPRTHGYNFLNFNCEHFVSYCIAGTSYSNQTRRISKTADDFLDALVKMHITPTQLSEYCNGKWIEGIRSRPNFKLIDRPCSPNSQISINDGNEIANFMDINDTKIIDKGSHYDFIRQFTSTNFRDKKENVYTSDIYDNPCDHSTTNSFQKYSSGNTSVGKFNSRRYIQMSPEKYGQHKTHIKNPHYKAMSSSSNRSLRKDGIVNPCFVSSENLNVCASDTGYNISYSGEPQITGTSGKKRFISSNERRVTADKSYQKSNRCSLNKITEHAPGYPIIADQESRGNQLQEHTNKQLLKLFTTIQDSNVIGRTRSPDDSFLSVGIDNPCYISNESVATDYGTFKLPLNASSSSKSYLFFKDRKATVMSTCSDSTVEQVFDISTDFSENSISDSYSSLDETGSDIFSDNCETNSCSEDSYDKIPSNNSSDDLSETSSDSCNDFLGQNTSYNCPVHYCVTIPSKNISSVVFNFNVNTACEASENVRIRERPAMTSHCTPFRGIPVRITAKIGDEFTDEFNINCSFDTNIGNALQIHVKDKSNKLCRRKGKLNKRKERLFSEDRAFSDIIDVNDAASQHSDAKKSPTTVQNSVKTNSFIPYRSSLTLPQKPKFATLSGSCSELIEKRTKKKTSMNQTKRKL